jgi:hypothetical protein
MGSARVVLVTAAVLLTVSPAAARADSGLLTIVKTAYGSTVTNVGHLYDDGGYRDCDLTCDGWVKGYTWTGTPPSDTVHATPASGWAFSSWTEADGTPGDPCIAHPGSAPDACTAQPKAPSEHRIAANFIDIAKPSATISGVGPGPYRGTVSFIQVSGTDQQTSVVSTQVLVNGAVVSNRAGSSASHTYTTPAGEGSVTLVPQATDQGGNTATGTGVKLAYDNVSPTLQITGGPGEGESRPEGDVTFEFSAGDSSSVAVECAADGGSYGPCTGAGRYTINAPALGTHTFKLRATDGPGNQTELIRTFRVVAAPPPAVGPLKVDARMVFEFSVNGTRTRIVRLAAKNVPSGAKVRLRCAGRGCPFKRRSVPVGSHRTAAIAPAFGHRALRAGTVIEVRVTAPGQVGMLVRFTLRKRRLPAVTRLCLPVGGAAPKRC